MLGNRDSSIEKQYRQTNHFNFTSPQRSHNWCQYIINSDNNNESICEVWCLNWRFL
jgi:hypothetical protein